MEEVEFRMNSVMRYAAQEQESMRNDLPTRLQHLTLRSWGKRACKALDGPAKTGKREGKSGVMTGSSHAVGEGAKGHRSRAKIEFPLVLSQACRLRPAVENVE